LQKDEKSITLAGRIFIVVFVVLGAYCLTFWLSLAFIPLDAYGLVAPVAALLCAAAAGRYVWVSLGSSAVGGVWQTTLLWAVVLGGVCFLIGFFFPIIFLPTANQGPLLGIFITGPLGFLLGGVAGFIYALRQRRKIGTSNGIADDA